MSHQHIVSVKAVIVTSEGVVLLRNDRDEWELPGGQLEQGEDPRSCVAREVKEELGVEVSVGRLLDAWQFRPVPATEVLIIAYACMLQTADTLFEISHEHDAVGVFSFSEIDGIAIPEGYVRAIGDARYG